MSKSCEEVCQEHSGIKTMLSVVIVGILCTIALQSYNAFIATAEIKAAIAGIQSDMNGLRNADKELERRVSKLEDVVYKK